MTRKELLSDPAYWTYQIQADLFKIIQDYLEENHVSQTEFGKTLGVTKGYISQVLNGNFDHKVSKLVSLAMGTGKVPCITFKDLKQVIEDDRKGIWHKDSQNEAKMIVVDVKPALGYTSNLKLSKKSKTFSSQYITTLTAGILENDTSEYYY